MEFGTLVGIIILFIFIWFFAPVIQIALWILGGLFVVLEKVWTYIQEQIESAKSD